MYKAHYEGNATAIGFRNLGVCPRGMSKDAKAIMAVQAARQAGISGVYPQKELAKIIFENFNPIETPAHLNVVDGTDKHEWRSVQVCQNMLQDMVKNGLTEGLFYRCDRNGDQVEPGAKAPCYYVIPDLCNVELNIQTAWEQP